MAGDSCAMAKRRRPEENRNLTGATKGQSKESLSAGHLCRAKMAKRDPKQSVLCSHSTLPETRATDNDRTEKRNL